jgi:glycosyltransferase involved in cell wall biosynthesis
LRVAIDATPLVVPFGGTNRYIVELVGALASHFPNDEFHLVSDQTNWVLSKSLESFRNIVVEGPQWGGVRGMWWSSGLPWELLRRRIDVFHGTDFSVPYVPVVPSVMMVHDLSPWKQFPIRPSGSDRVRIRAPYLMRIATRIITPTEAIRRELSRTFGIAGRRITAVPLAAFEAGGEMTGSSLNDKLKVPAPYLLYVGSREPRKNVEGLVRSWRGLRQERPGVSLALVGPPGSWDETASREDGLHVFGTLPDTQVNHLLSGATAFVYPSLYEGFGLPVLEAMKRGVPVITSLDPAITEVAGGAAVQVDVTSTERLSHAISSVVASSEAQVKLRDQGRQRASAFSWERTARRTRDVYSEAIRYF